MKYSALVSTRSLPRGLRPLSLLVVGCLAATGCAKAPPEKSASPAIATQTPSASAAPSPHPAPVAPVGSAQADLSDLKITWKTPAPWAATSAGGTMQKARYLAPPVSGDPEGATVTVFYFGPAMGGSVEANINRWIGQFTGVDKQTIKQSERSKGGLTQHIVEIPEGRFESGMMPGMPAAGGQGSGAGKEGWGMLGAVVEAPSGKYFFKMVGPKRTVASNKQAFDSLLDSIEQKP